MELFHVVLYVAIILALTDGAAIDLTTCGKSKGCVGIPSTCITTDTPCNAVATWSAQGTKIAFEMSTTTDGYVSLGTLEGTGSDRMSPATVMSCIRSGTTISMEYSKNTGRSNSPVSGTSGLTITSTEFDPQGVLRCFFTRDKIVSSNYPDLGGNNSYIALLAYGSVSGTVKQYHTGRVSTTDKVNFEVNAQVTAAGGSGGSGNLVKAHGIIMIFAWVLFACIGIMLARHYKDMWPATSVPGFNKPVWFSFHVICNILAMLLTVIGFIVIFSHRKGWSYLEGEDKVMRAHPYLGTLVTICAIINPLMAMCRPNPDAPSRWLFNLFHWMVGFVAQVLGLLMIFVGLKLKVSEPISSNWMIILLLVFVIVYFLVDLILLIIKCLPVKSSRTASEIEMRGAGDAGNDNSGPPKPPSSGLRTFLFVVVALFAIIATLAVVIGIGRK